MIVPQLLSFLSQQGLVMMWASSTKPKREGELDQGNHEE